MQNKSITNLPIAVSPLIYGTATSKMMAGENTDEILDAAFEAGITTFDTARLYGEAESVLGDWVRRRNLRSRVNILTKGCHPDNDKPRVSPQVIREELEISLKQLQTDYVDIYLLHRDDPNVEVGPIVECLNQLKEEGKIRVFGGSNWTPQRLSQANEYALSHGLQPFSISSPSFSLVEMVRDPWGGSVWLSGPSRAADREWYVNNQMPVFAYSSLARGFLSGRYRTDSGMDIEQCLSWAPIQEYGCPENIERLRRAEHLADEKGVSVPTIALAWALKQPLNLFCILGPSSPAHLDSLLCAFDVELTDREADWLNLCD